jgi:hypothetical protein
MHNRMHSPIIKKKEFMSLKHAVRTITSEAYIEE